MEAYGSVWICMDPYQESVWDFIHPQLGLWWSDELGELCVVLTVIHRCVPLSSWSTLESWIESYIRNPKLQAWCLNVAGPSARAVVVERTPLVLRRVCSDP